MRESSRVTATVLVVDDEPDIRLMARMALKHAGYRVIEAETGEAGLEALERVRPDVLVLDLRLPSMSGLQVIERMREASLLEAAYVVVVSAHASPSIHERVTALGVREYVTKPFAPGDLVAAVTRIVGR